MLQIVGLTKSFGDKVAVADVSLEVAEGSFLGIIGRSGAGKSTLLRAINRLGDASSGRVLWKGEEVSGLTGRGLQQWRSRCAMIFQQFNLIGRLDVLTNVLMGRLIHVPQWKAILNLWSREDRAIALSALEQFDISGFAAERAERLSGGQQQRVAIARALVQSPELVLADEPIASLDPRNSKVVMDALQRINRHFGLTVVCNLHSLDIARSYCDRLVGMAQGRVVFDGTPQMLTDAVARELYGIEAVDVVAPERGRSPATAKPAFA